MIPHIIIIIGVGIIFNCILAFYRRKYVICSLIITIPLVIYSIYELDANRPPIHPETTELFNSQTAELKQFIKKELSDPTKPPELQKLKDIARKKGLPVDKYLEHLAKGSSSDRGKVALLEQNYDEAIKQFKESTETNKKEDAENYLYIGNAFYLKKDYHQAKEAYKKSIDLNPNYAEAWYNWGTLLVEIGRYNFGGYDEAIEKF